MKISKPTYKSYLINDPYQKFHLELHSLFRQYSNGIDAIPDSEYRSKQSRADYKKYLIQSIEEYCQKYDLLYSDTFIEVQSKDEEYVFFLALSLIFFPLHLVQTYLAYQLEHYHSSKEEFFEMVKTKLISNTENYSLFDNSQRFILIMDWVEKTQTLFNSKILQKPVRKPRKFKMDWKKPFELLKRISILLYKNGFTEKPNDFYDVFDKGDPIVWTQSAESLIYFLNKIFTPPLQYFEVKNSNGTFTAAAEKMFIFLDDNKNVIKRTALRKIKYKLKKAKEHKTLDQAPLLDSLLMKAQKLPKSHQ